MDTQTNEATVKKHQVKTTFSGLIATVNVNGIKQSFDIADLPDDIKIDLLQYGWKQKVSDYRANDRLQGQDKLDAIVECHEMLDNGNFRQIRAKAETMSLEDRLIAWDKMTDNEKLAVKSVDPSLYNKLFNVSMKKLVNEE